MPDLHAKLSASGSHRWMACPGSLLLERYYEDKGSEYADEGTKAHRLAEALLRQILHGVKLSAVAEKEWKAADIEMQRYVSEYAEYCKDIYDTLLLKDKTAQAFVEEKVRYDDYVPEGFGTTDFLAIGDNQLHTVDFKYGKGVSVSAINNSQQRLYTLGALKELGFLFDFDKITMHIYQPRIGNISTEIITKTELLDWGESVVKPKAKKAYEGTREFESGEHCRFCKARATCKTRANNLLGALIALLGGKNGH